MSMKSKMKSSGHKTLDIPTTQPSNDSQPETSLYEKIVLIIMNANRVNRDLNEDKQTRHNNPEWEGSVSSDEEGDTVPDWVAFNLMPMAETLCSESLRTHECKGNPLSHFPFTPSGPPHPPHPEPFRCHTPTSKPFPNRLEGHPIVGGPIRRPHHHYVSFVFPLALIFHI